ncbi:MAG: ROK family protein [Actinomycetes bacterium]
MTLSRSAALAIDIGGTKIDVGVVDREGTILSRERAATPAQGSGDAMFAVIVGLIEKVNGSSGSDPIVCGVGTGGPMTRGGAEVSPVNISAWRSFPLLERLSVATGLPTFIDNDAKALALGEGWLGAAQGIENYLAMVVSTGVGGGIVLDGRLLDGADGNAGHIGHICVEPEGRVCGCGARGCLEAEASGTAIAAFTGRPAAEASPEVIERTGRLVGRAVATVANLLDLRLAVVAGSVALGFGDPFFVAANDEIERRARLDFSRGCELRRGGLGADGPLIGAAAVGWRGLRQ